MRQDIQSLRGIAILFVFTYHLFPTVFVNGFLGVDIFFVISGFLMAKNLTRSEIKNVHDILKFYYRRFKRILPLYYLTIFCSVVCVHLYLGEFWWKPNQRYSLASLFLVTNQLVIHDQADYFRAFLADESSKNAFLHMWSLSLEMQFYLLVPFIFFALQFLNSNLLRLAAVSIMTSVGLLCFLFLNAQFAFNFMFLRLWQFSAGFTAFYWSTLKARGNTEKSEKCKSSTITIPFDKSDLVTAALIIISLCLVPNRITVILLRPFVTLATAVVIGCDLEDTTIFKWSSLAYLGNISYVVYLVHWPVITIFLGTTVKSYVMCIVITLILSASLHHFYEKPCLTLSKFATFSVVLSLICANSIIQHSIRMHDFWKHTVSSDLQDIIDRNKGMHWMWDLSDRKDPCIEDSIPDKVAKGFFGFCRYPRGNGNISVFMLGNSYTVNFAEPIRNQFNYNYSEFRYLSIGENYGFYGGNEFASRALEISRKHVELYRPEVLFFVSRLIFPNNVGYSPNPRHSPDLRDRIEEHDKWLEEMNENLAFYEKFVKQIYILGAHPSYSYNAMGQFLHYATQNREELENMHLVKSVADENMRNVRKRLNSIKCSKCHLFDLSHVFVENDKYLTFDRDTMLSYVDDEGHLTPHGLELCEPVLQQIVHNITQGL